MAGAVREFVPVRPGHVSIYLCGATVQGLPHIGHVRSGVAFDVLRRWLMAKGYDVAFIRNVTDIDDKILNKAADAGRPWWEWAATYERAFSAAYDALGVLPPSAEPRATGHITQIVELIERLIERGHAYAGGGDVYFNVLSLPEYGKLSGHRIDDVHQGEGVATGKRDERDFTLWKGAKPGEPSWPTPWGRGRPGWHTECVAMCEAYLGAEFDIHAGGMDLVFPHHENEIAQAEAAGDPFARLLAAQRLGDHGRREDEQVAGQRPGDSGCAATGSARGAALLPRQRALPVDAGVHRDRPAGRGQGLLRDRGLPAPRAQPGRRGGARRVDAEVRRGARRRSRRCRSRSPRCTPHAPRATGHWTPVTTKRRWRRRCRSGR